jgi:protein ImuB
VSWLETSCDGQDLSDLIDRLGARFGLRRVTRLASIDTHWPEFAVTAVPAAGHAPLPVSASETGRGWVRGKGTSRDVEANPLAPHPNPLPTCGEREVPLYEPIR